MTVKAGIAKDPRYSLEQLSTFDNQEDLTTAGADIALTSGVLGDGGSGVGDGTDRSLYYCRAVMNVGSSAVTVKYCLIRSGATDTAQVYTVYVNAGSRVDFHDNVGLLDSTADSGATIKLFYKRREILDQTSPTDGTY